MSVSGQVPVEHGSEQPVYQPDVAAWSFVSAPIEIVRVDDRVIVRRPSRLPLSAWSMGLGATFILLALVTIVAWAAWTTQASVVLAVSPCVAILGLVGIWFGAIAPYTMDEHEPVRFEANTATGIAKFPRTGLSLTLGSIARIERVRFSQTHVDETSWWTDTIIVYQDSTGDLRGVFVWRGGRKARAVQLASLLGVPLVERRLRTKVYAETRKKE